MSDAWFTLRWQDGAVAMLDQRRLPIEETYLALRSVEEVARAIEDLAVRGAPAIGCAAALGIALAAQNSSAPTTAALHADLMIAAERLARTRPTAVNLFWALGRMRVVADRVCGGADVAAACAEVLAEAENLVAEDEAICRALGDVGAEIVPDGARILTHCNAGGLATAGWGTALGVVRSAVAAGRRVEVLADETRPFLQGARLTAWELARDHIPVTVLTDNMTGHLMARGEVDLVIVGADRIAANGDVANKIGTYTVALLAREHGIPFYVAAPLSTIDLETVDGAAIPIEERGPEEVTHFCGQAVVPEGVPVRNPAFDVTPARLVAGIVTEHGIARPPYTATLRGLFASE